MVRFVSAGLEGEVFSAATVLELSIFKQFDGDTTLSGAVA